MEKLSKLIDIYADNFVGDCVTLNAVLPDSPPKAVVVLSGGQDSTTCLWLAKMLGYEIHTVTFDYGQKHRVEIGAARHQSQAVGAASHEVIKTGPILNGTSPLVSDAPLAQYKDHSSLPGGLEKTFVPMRNQMFLTLAANRAYCLGTNILFTGVCQEDSGGYPDCTQVFIDALERASSKGSFTGEDGAPPALKIYTPLMYLTKAESVLLAKKIPSCYGALAHTITGYDGAFPPVGKDHATLLRAKGFEEAGVPDPLVLRANMKGLMELPSTDNYSPASVLGHLPEMDL